MEAVVDLEKAASSEFLVAFHPIRSARAATLMIYPVDVLAALAWSTPST